MNDPTIHAVLPNKNLVGFINKAENPLLKAQLNIWNTIRDEYKLEDKLYIIQWSAPNPMFKINKLGYRFNSWIAREITTFYSLTEKYQLRDFEYEGKISSLKKMFYTYLQLCNHFEHNLKNKTDFNDQNKKSNTTELIKEKRKREGNLSTSSETWLDMCRLPWKCTNSNI